METKEADWQKHPRYLADVGACFGAPPRLACVDCKKSGYELFYGHCRGCAEKKNIPRKGEPAQAFHDALGESKTTVTETRDGRKVVVHSGSGGTMTVVAGAPKSWYPWWHPRRWFQRS